MSRGQYTDHQIADVKDRNPVSRVFAHWGRVPKGRDSKIICPFHSEKTASCYLDDARQQFHCFGCGQHGDVIDAVMAFKKCSFVDAMDALGAQKEIPPARQSELDQLAQERRKADDEAKTKSHEKAERVFNRGLPAKNTPVTAYLKFRGLLPTPAFLQDIRYLADYPYWGYADYNGGEPVELAKAPCMVAAIRNPATGKIIGAHRTYLAEDGRGKFKPPGDQKRNKAKKITGEFAGGWIMLSEPAEYLILGEGIETTGSADPLELSSRDEFAMAAAVNLWNLSGSAMRMIEHPRNKGKYIPAIEPNPDKPALLLPSWVKAGLLLLDGDSDMETTCAKIALARKKFFDTSHVAFSVANAPAGSDWNDVRMNQLRQ